MPEYRRDPFSGEWVIVAAGRADRPSEFVASPAKRPMVRCPFCPGNEADTPQPLAVFPAAASVEESAFNWQVRVIPNKYPATTRNAEILAADGAASGEFAESFFAVSPGHGAHEVIIESPQHVASFSDIAPEQARWACQAYRDRLRALRGESQLKYALLFKNCRGGAGATLEHTHSQLLATSFLPPRVAQKWQAAVEYRRSAGGCLFCRLRDWECAAGIRLIQRTAHFSVYAPFASRFAYETWIVPSDHASRYEDASDAVLDEFALLLQSTVRSLETHLPDVAYNFWIHTAPFHLPDDSPFHWHVEIIPRLTMQAGFEWGTGTLVNPVLPEAAAAALRRYLSG